MFPKIGGFPPKWMVYNGINPIKMDYFWGYHYFQKHPNGVLIDSPSKMAGASIIGVFEQLDLEDGISHPPKWRG